MPIVEPPSTLQAPSHARSLLLAHGAVVLFGFAALFGEWLALAPVAIVLGRTAIAAATLAAVRWTSRIALGRPSARMLANGAVLAFHWVTFFAAIQVSSVAIGLLGYASFPLFTLLLEVALRQRRARARDAAVSVLVVAGLVLVVPAPSWADPMVRGLALGIVSAFAFALLAILNRTEAAKRSALDIALWQNVAAAVCLVPFVTAMGASSLPGPREWLLLIVLGVLCTALAHTLFIAALQGISAHAASVVAALEPVYGILLAWLWLGQAPSLRMVGGAAILVAAAVLVSQRDH